MKTRRAFRPAALDRLEDRLALSALAPSPIASGPIVTATAAGSQHAETLTRSGKPDRGQLTFSAQELAPVAPGGVATIKVDYHNESSKPISSASIVESLKPGFAYVQGVHAPTGGEVSVESAAKGGESVKLDLPGGIAPGAEGYLEFQVKPTR